MDAGIHRTCFLVDVCAISPFADASRGPWMELLDDRPQAVDHHPRAAQMVGDEVTGLVSRGRGRMLLRDNPADYTPISISIVSMRIPSKVVPSVFPHIIDPL